MKFVATTQRVGIDPRHGERRDMLDQRWSVFLASCGLGLLPLPNRRDSAVALLETASSSGLLAGLLLTGGNDLTALGGDAPERDEAELALIARAVLLRLPVLGVCRGLQIILHAFGATLVRLEGHIAVHHPIEGSGGRRIVNSYHSIGVIDCPSMIEPLAYCIDGSVEQARHREELIAGIMWHPERELEADPLDLELFRETFRP